MSSDLTAYKINEVYNRIDCADSGIAQELCDFFTFKVPGYQFMPAYKNKMWSGDIRLYNIRDRKLYGGLMGYVEEFCDQRGYNLSYQYDNGTKEFSLHEAKEFIAEQNFTLTPHDYQIDAFVSAVRTRRQLFVSPTASGKSFMIYMIMRYFLVPTLIVVPTLSLVQQMYSDFEDYGFNASKYVHKVYAGQDHDTDKPIVIGTWQSLYKKPKKWFTKFSMIVGDEAHLFQAKSLCELMEKCETIPLRFGFTGTLSDTKTHKLVLAGLFGPVRQITTTSELIEQGHVSDLFINILHLQHNQEDCRSAAKFSYIDEMRFLVGHEKRNRFIKNLALSLKNNTLLLFQYVDTHGRQLYDMIHESAGDRKVFFVYGGVSGDEREEIRRIVEKENDAIIVASYGVFSTGVNIKNLHNVIFASPSKSKIRNLQSIGRGLRKSDGKELATLFDIGDNLTWKKKTNFTLLHLYERLRIYKEEKFRYKTYNIRLS